MSGFFQIGPPVPEKKIFEGILPYMVMAAIVVIWPGLFIYTLVAPSYRRHIKFGFDWPSGFRGEDIWILLKYTCILSRGGIFDA